MMDRQFRFVKPNGLPTDREVAADAVYNQLKGLRNRALDDAINDLIHGPQGDRRRLTGTDLNKFAEVIQLLRRHYEGDS